MGLPLNVQSSNQPWEKIGEEDDDKMKSKRKHKTHEDDEEKGK